MRNKEKEREGKTKWGLKVGSRKHLRDDEDNNKDDDDDNKAAGGDDKSSQGAVSGLNVSPLSQSQCLVWGFFSLLCRNILHSAYAELRRRSSKKSLLKNTCKYTHALTDWLVRCAFWSCKLIQCPVAWRCVILGDKHAQRHKQRNNPYGSMNTVFLSLLSTDIVDIVKFIPGPWCELFRWLEETGNTIQIRSLQYWKAESSRRKKKSTDLGSPLYTVFWINAICAYGSVPPYKYCIEKFL